MAGTTLSQQYWFSDTYAIEDQHGIIEIRQPTASTTSGVQIRIHGTSYSSGGTTYNVRFVNANNTSNDYNFTYETVNSTDDKDFDSGWKTSTVSCSTGNDTFYVRIYCAGVVNKMYTLTGKVYWVNSSPPSTTYTKCSPPSSVFCGDGTNWYTPVYNTTASGAPGSGTGKFYCKWNAGTAGQNTSIAGYTLKEDGSAYYGSTYTNDTNASTLQYYSSGWHSGAVDKTYKCTVKTRSTVSGYDSDYSTAYSSVKFSAVQTSVTLTLNANSGSVSPTSKTEYYGTTADLPTPTRTGYQFGGWYYNCTGSNSFNYQTGYKFTGSFSISLWTEATSYSSYATIFSCTEYGGISLCYESGTTGWRFYFYDGAYKSVTIPVAQVTPGYHTWCCVFNSSTKKIELFLDGVSKGTTAVSTTSCTWSSVNLLIGAEPNSSNAAGTPYFTGKVGNIVITNDTTVRSPNPTSMSMPYSNSTVYAYWVPDVHRVTLNQQSGSGGTTAVNATYAAAMPSITVPTRTGYTFGGYYDATGGSGTQYYTAAGASARTWNKTADTTLYAKWTAINVTITLNANSGSGGTSSVTIAYGTAQGSYPSIVKPTRTGYNFNGFWSATSGGTQWYDANGNSLRTFNLTANTTWYAQWTAKTYTVTVNLNGGTGGPGSSFTATYGTNKSLTAPTKAGYDFVGWACTSGSRLSQDYSAVTGFFSSVPTKYLYGGSGTNNSTLASATMDTGSGFPNTVKMLTITEPGTSSKGVGWARTMIPSASTAMLYTFVAKAPLGTYFVWAANSIGTGSSHEWLTPQAGTGSWQTYCIKVTSGTGTISSFGHMVVCGNTTTVSGATNPGNITANVAWSSIGLYSKLNAACTYVPADISSDAIYAIWIEKKYTIAYNLNGGSFATATDSVATSGNYREALNPLTAQWTRSPYIMGTSNGGVKATANSPGYWFKIERPTKAASISSSTSPITTSFSAASAVTAIGSTKTITTTTPQNFYSWTITGMDSSTHHYWGRTSTAVTTNSNQSFTSTSTTLTAAHNTGGVPLEFYNLRQSAGTVTFTAGWTNGTATSATTYSNITLPTVPGKSNTTATTTRTVYYNANGGTGTTTAQSVTPSATVTWSDDDKWYTASSGGTGYAQGLTTYKPTASATLYAHYTASTGTYSSPTVGLRAALTKTSTSTTVTTTITLNFNAASTVNAVTTTKTVTTTQPYSFNKWAQGSATGSTTYSAGATFTPTAASVTFYATWTNGTATSATIRGSVTLPTVPGKGNTTATITRTVNYNANGGSSTPSAQSVSPTATVTWADDDKWYTASSGGTGYSQGTSYTLTADNATLYAHYTGTTGTYSSPTVSLASAINKTSTTATKYVNYDKNTGTTVSAASTSFIATTAYTFDKWKLGSTTGTAYSAGGTYTPTAGSTTFYATFTGSTTAASVTTATATKSATTASVTLTYNLNTGTTVSPASVSYGVTVTWTGAGWYTAASGGTLRAAMGAKYTPPVAGETVYAHWNENGRTAPSVTLPVATKDATTSSGTVLFNPNGGTVTITSKTFTLTTSYTNTQWNIGSASGTKLGNAGAQVTAPTTSATVYAVWSSSTSAGQVGAPVPTRTGYTCTGWYTAASGGTRKVAAGSSYTPPVAGETLYAQWADATGYYNGRKCCYVYNGSSWKRALPYVYTEGILTRYLVTSDQVNVRTGPGQSYTSVGHVNTGDVVMGRSVVSGEGLSWLHVIGGTWDNCYIAAQYLSSQGAVNTWVIAKPLIYNGTVWK